MGRKKKLSSIPLRDILYTLHYGAVKGVAEGRGRAGCIQRPFPFLITIIERTGLGCLLLRLKLFFTVRSCLGSQVNRNFRKVPSAT